MKDLTIVNNTSLQNENNDDINKLMLDAVNRELAKEWKNIYDFVAELFIDTAKNAKAPDVKWNLHTDYWNKNRAAENLMKIINPKAWGKNINVGLFVSPPAWKPLNH